MLLKYPVEVLSRMMASAISGVTPGRQERTMLSAVLIFTLPFLSPSLLPAESRSADSMSNSCEMSRGP